MLWVTMIKQARMLLALKCSATISASRAFVVCPPFFTPALFS